MVDARVPERYLSDRRVLRTSDKAFRLLITGTVFAVSNRTDGVIAEDDISLMPKVRRAAADELVELGLWHPIDGGWAIDSFLEQQTSKDALDRLERIRRTDREKKARQRAEKKGVVSPGELSLGQSPATTQAGQDRQDFSQQEKEFETDEFGFPREPALFCGDHPRGGAGRCVPCMDARRLHEKWQRIKKRRVVSDDWMNRPSTPAAPTRDENGRCLHTNMHPNSQPPFCLNCQSVVAA